MTRGAKMQPDKSREERQSRACRGPKEWSSIYDGHPSLRHEELHVDDDLNAEWGICFFLTAEKSRSPAEKRASDDSIKIEICGIASTHAFKGLSSPEVPIFLAIKPLSTLLRHLIPFGFAGTH